jgi:hypothetical protein
MSNDGDEYQEQAAEEYLASIDNHLAEISHAVQSEKSPDTGEENTVLLEIRMHLYNINDRLTTLVALSYVVAFLMLLITLKLLWPEA